MEREQISEYEVLKGLLRIFEANLNGLRMVLEPDPEQRVMFVSLLGQVDELRRSLDNLVALPNVQEEGLIEPWAMAV